MSEEIFDVCDEQDNVIGQAPRSVVHARKLLHRAVHIWVFNSSGELLTHMRSATKDEFPSTYTSSASGHLSAGETYDEAAPRELEEELGIRAELTRLTSLPASPATAYEHTVLYRCTTDATPRPDPGEVAAVEFRPFAYVAEMARTSPEKFSPPFLQLVEWAVANGVGRS
ncbi:NUDIX hydrolase [Planctomyces sp. SH-PL14]|uniref:NUDIX hydrolase n=1 Tax=Planctomyces sp. SH-PL14 TaxID=1632864 RepID=UPI00078D38A9|nr:NUDIX domain-containing protein [Planctomyces sp. SH-PL14]AMV21102.1 Nudix hydrolase [Planctomyces sp. SH-PL14]